MTKEELAANVSYAADQAAAHFTAGRLLMVALFLSVAAFYGFKEQIAAAIGKAKLAVSRKQGSGSGYTVVGPLRDRIAKLQALESAMLALGDSPDKVHAAIGAHVFDAIDATAPEVSK